MIVVVMGVSGSGKTTTGRALAAGLGWRFLDADDFHPPENVAKMRGGTALTDADRWPWLDALAAEIGAIDARGQSAVLACSALREAYRERLRRAAPIRIVHLDGDREVIAARLAARHGHYMPASLLASQLAALEPPAEAIRIDLAQPPDAQVAAIRRALELP